MQGSAGTKNPLSEEDIAEADVILLATDMLSSAPGAVLLEQRAP
jgi:fructose-specific phosphotransferase system component IIB